MMRFASTPISCLAILTLLGCFVTSAAIAEPFSVRCSDGKAPFPYFATFDIEARKAAFQASSSASSARGDIRSVTDEKIEFTIRGDGGSLDFEFQRRQMRMLWAGIGADWIRPVLLHPCVSVPVRTPLSGFDDKNYVSDPAQLFSIKCSDLGQPYYFTFDSKTKKVAFEGKGGGVLYPGDVQSETDKGVTFIIGWAPKFELVWNGRDKIVTWIGVPGDAARPKKENQCERIPTRTVLDMLNQP